MTDRLEFVVDDVVNGDPIAPSSMPVGLLNQFHEQTARFLKGTHSDIDLDSLRVSIEKGSYKLVLPTTVLVSGLASDIALLANGNLDDMDTKRAEVVEEWQKAAQRIQTRRYGLLPESGQPIQIHSGTRLERHENAIWVAVEKYIHGDVMDLGGIKPNLHLKLRDGTNLTVSTNLGQLRDEEKNLVYRSAMLRVKAEEDIVTGKIRNIHLLEFVPHSSSFEANELDEMVAKGRVAWADVPNATEWVEMQRGGS
ncbi:MAG: hypothetical protein K0U79_07095 [Gammaproteobacteria bacterium]|nr:hypothetical protein [Gammaproteobacteria bacterium]